MARFRPFRGVRFRADAVGSMEDVVAPPYDVIDEVDQRRLCAASPYNATHLILNPAGHDAAARSFREWCERGVLERDEQACFYLYCQEFECGGPRRRVGVIGALHLEPFARRVVLPHERTFSHHKDDRFELTTRVKANLSPIFGLYSNPGFHPRPESGWDAPAEFDVDVSGVRHRLWRLTSPATIAEIEAALAGRRVFIADGHHRYETALNYYESVHPGLEPPAGEDAPDDAHQPSAHVMAFLAAFEDPGMVILPTHRELLDCAGADLGRFVETLERDFRVHDFGARREGLLAALEEAGRRADTAVGVALNDPPRFLLVFPQTTERSGSPLEGLDVRLLHAGILDGALREAGARSIELAYTVEREALLERVASGRAAAAFLLNPTRAEQLAQVCEAGELMPQKSTYFYPKLLTGLVFHTL